MQRYFFHVRGGQFLLDREGTELPTIGAAKREAVRYAGELLSDNAETFWDTGDWVLRVTDANDMTLFQLTFFATDPPALRKL